MEFGLDDFVTHADLAAFAENKVNLPTEDAAAGRKRVNTLRDRLTEHIAANPDFDLVKMLHAGSVAKGTALRTANDMDLAVYVRDAAAPDDSQLVSWLVDRLREAYQGFLEANQIQGGTHCATVTFKSGTIRNVDVVPILYEGDDEDFGFLIAKDTGDRLLTSVRLHLEFVRGRKKTYPVHYAQLMRLVKWWIRQQRQLDGDFRFKSFMAELIVTHLVDSGVQLASYPDALEAVFGYVFKSGLQERISFSDYYKPSELPSTSDAVIEVFDPVNASNNVAYRYLESDRERIVLAAQDALGAIVEARYATTKSRAIECWQIVFGPSFHG
jgi:hypothetical protein